MSLNAMIYGRLTTTPTTITINQLLHPLKQELIKITYHLKIVNAWTERGFGKKRKKIKAVDINY